MRSALDQVAKTIGARQHESYMPSAIVKAACANGKQTTSNHVQKFSANV